MSALTGRPSSVRERGEGKALLTNAAKPQPKGLRDPHKYDWMPPDPPRIPRIEQMSLLRTALMLLVALLLTGAVAWGALAWNALSRFVGWLW